MGAAIRIGLVGDYDAAVTAHRAIPRALTMAGSALGLTVEARWLPTDAVSDDAVLAGHDGLWLVPASPYRRATSVGRASTTKPSASPRAWPRRQPASAALSLTDWTP